MIKFLNDYKKVFISLIFAYLYLLVVLIIPTNYKVIIPGGLTNINSDLSLSDYDYSNNFHSIYVSTYQPLTIFQNWLLKNNPQVEIAEITSLDKTLSSSDNLKIGSLSREVSYQYALINSYNMANAIDSKFQIAYSFLGLKVYYRPQRISEVAISDLVVGVKRGSDTIYLRDVGNDIAKIALFLEMAESSSVTLLLFKDGQEIEYFYTRGADELSLRFYPYYEITSATPSFKLLETNSNIGGPSGGLMQTLSIYATLLNINLNNLVISGTGTIEYDGAVGKIGGEVQKIYTAASAFVDYFIITSNNVSVDCKITKVTNKNEVYATSGTGLNSGKLIEIRHNFKEFIIVSSLKEAIEVINEISKKN